MVKNIFFRKVYIIPCLLFVFFSCSDDKGITEDLPQTFNVDGKVEKGPFVSGSEITLQPMDRNMNPLGSMFSTTISNNSGSFSFGSKELDAPFAQLTANGYFFNECNGELSKGTLSLRSIVNLNDASSVNVNILTHLKYQRIFNLVESGKSFDEANKQAQEELLTEFGLQRFSNKDASQYSIASGTDEAGALIAISSLLLVDRSEAQLTEYLSKLSEEFGKNGSFSSTSKQQFHSDRIKLAHELTDIASNIISRYDDLGIDVTVKDLLYFFDWDGDGIAGNEITDGDEMVTLEVNELNVPTEGGEYIIKINSPIPLTLTPEVYREEPEEQISTDYYYTILHEDYRDTVSYTKELNDLTLKIHIEPSTARRIDPVVIQIYNYMGYSVAALKIKQEGNPEGKIFADNFLDILFGADSDLSKSVDLYQAMDSWYTKLTVNDGFKAPLNSDNSYISTLWGNFYATIARNNIIRKQLTELSLSEQGVQEIVNEIDILQSPLKTLNALSYYSMVTFWGDVPYITEPLDIGNMHVSRRNIDEIFKSLEEDLIIAFLELENKKNNFNVESEEQFIFFSNDVPRIVLAWIYMYQGNYMDARLLLQFVEQGGYYQLEKETNYSLNSSELIYGLKVENGLLNSSVVPVLTYSDVILSLAECELRLGNNGSAREYLNSISQVKNISVSSDILIGIKDARKQVCNINYLAFLQRNNLIEAEIGLEEYQHLFPIPLRELNLNPNMTQNPGY